MPWWFWTCAGIVVGVVCTVVSGAVLAVMAFVDDALSHLTWRRKGH